MRGNPLFTYYFLSVVKEWEKNVIAVIILNLYIRSRWAVTFASSLYCGGHKPIYPLNRRFCWPQCRCERFEENKNLLLLQETEPWFFYCSTSDTPMLIALSVLLFVFLFKTLIFVSFTFIYETLGFVRILWLETRYYPLIPLSNFTFPFISLDMRQTENHVNAYSQRIS
jgi:hypothetical protein